MEVWNGVGHHHESLMEYDVDDSDEWVYSAEWIAADLDDRRRRRLAAEQYLADKIAEDLMTNRWYLIESIRISASVSVTYWK